ncbi:Os03g0194450 [Oryza sativa Japonica Group]|uniref:Os03g0194450 protein n=1 Tax=Oryza sativa subsp. japonica TaxID=39947 RepID=A0A0N7KGR5_ORYSJ|nr:hypothetical protein EE612_015853 [Oryza sativa]BAS82753.1 Os03g0194450 [Oryza sativa Japonica Group]
MRMLQRLHSFGARLVVFLLKARPVQQPAIPALTMSSLPRSLLNKHTTRLWTPERTAKLTLAEDPAVLNEPLNPFLVNKPCPG